MTCRIQAKITYNWPIVVEKANSLTAPPEVIFKSQGEPKTFIGEHEYNLDEWFSGDQVITVREQ